MIKYGDREGLTEDNEGKTPPNGSVCNFGDWKVIVHKDGLNNGFGFRRYHKHGANWYCVVNASRIYYYQQGHYPEHEKWKCGHCHQLASPEMEGYIKMVRWSEE